MNLTQAGTAPPLLFACMGYCILSVMKMSLMGSIRRQQIGKPQTSVSSLAELHLCVVYHRLILHVPELGVILSRTTVFDEVMTFVLFS